MPEESRFVNEKRENLKCDLIEITEDKLENILVRHLAKLGTRKAWIAPLSLLITSLLAILTGTFSTKFGIDAAVWRAVFVLLAIGSLAWLVVSLVQLCICWKSSSLKDLIAIIKNAKKQGS